MYILYNLILIPFTLIAFPYFLFKIFKTGKYYHSFLQKMGFLPYDFARVSGMPRIWINAVSVGEVLSAGPVVAAIRDAYPSAGIIFSTVTETGQKIARQMIKDVDYFCYFPLDFPWIVKKFLKLINPDLFITVETEIWPNILRMAKKRGVKTMLLNGRISVRSIGRYQKSRFFWKRVLQYFDVMSMISSVDQERIIAMGAAPKRVVVNGSSKYDKLADQIEPAYEVEMRKILNIPEGTRVFIAGSIHQEEEKLVFEAYRQLQKRFHDILLIIAPRYPDRGPKIEKFCKEHSGFDCIRKTAIDNGERRGDKPVVILDTLGELFKVYSLGNIILCGGSFVSNRGGHNILEPAAWGKVVFYGPIMDDFLDAKNLLEGVGAGESVRNAGELVKKGVDLLENLDKIRILGESARKVVLANSGAAKRNVELVKKLLTQT